MDADTDKRAVKVALLAVGLTVVAWAVIYVIGPAKVGTFLVNVFGF